MIDDVELTTFKKAYQKKTYFFSLAGSKEQWQMSSNNYGFYSREIDLKEVQRIRGSVNPLRDKKIVFLGLGMKIGVDSLEQLPIWNSPNCVFLVSANVQVNHKNVYQIPTDYLESQNYIASSDLVISKAGWGMIGEANSANVPLLILNRPSMQEDQNTIEYLMEQKLCELDRLKTEMNGSDLVHYNQAERIANDLLRLL